jgi:hypothetical protein
MLGFGLGVIGMSLDDWSGLSPDEFSAVCQSYNDKEEARLHDEWERMRLLATITIQPHVKNRLHAEKLLPLPWDGKPKKTDAPKVSKEEAKSRFEQLLKKD